uniref:Chemosensory protein 12 n=1 Tax=Grapholita molesta TaxID=192188 RepID=A0A5J6K996_GRAMO|nr:chemosensory protein 12 [Grapholita molesta]
MLSEIILSCLVTFRITSAEPTIAGIDRTMSDGVRSMGYNVMYGDEDFTVLNSVIDEVERKASKAKINLNELIQPLPAMDVKCLMSADHYCSKDMKETKSVIIQAIKDDCKDCSTPQKENAGRVIAAMMAHDPTSWKLFLTRYDGIKKIQRIMG